MRIAHALSHPTLVLLPLCLIALAPACGDEDIKGGGADGDTVLTPSDTNTVGDTNFADVDTVGPCDPIDQSGCKTGENCTFVGSATAPSCAAGGPVAASGECSAEQRCATGVCMSVNQTANLCYQFCVDEGDCGTDGTCLTLSNAPFRVCKIEGIYQACDLLAQDCTAEGKACYAVSTETTPICLPEGTSTPGGACEHAGSCKKGYACVNDVCRAVCDAKVPASCGEGATCRDFAFTVGYCEPN